MTSQARRRRCWRAPTQTVTWDVAGTERRADQRVRRCKISLSTDGGATYPNVLADGTPNDGSATVTLPNVATTKARIKVEAVGNVFFDVSDADVTIQEPILGFAGLAPATDTLSSTLPEAFRNIARGSGSVDKLTVYVENGTTAGWLVAGIYSDANGHPGTLLGQNDGTPLTKGAWNTVSLPARAAHRRPALLDRGPGPGRLLKIRPHSGGKATQDSATGRTVRAEPAADVADRHGVQERRAGLRVRQRLVRRRRQRQLGVVTRGPTGNGRPPRRYAGGMRRRLTPVDRVGVDERAAVLGKRSIKAESQQAAIRLAVSMVDLTTLEGQDTPGKVAQLAAKAVCPAPTHPEMPSCAAVCVYPSRVAGRQAARSRAPASPSPRVATGFPSGLTSMELKLEETRQAVADGAEEIDMVIPRDAYLSGDDAARDRRGRAGQGGLRAGPPEGDRRGRRAGRLRPHPPRDACSRWRAAPTSSRRRPARSARARRRAPRW